MLFLNQLFGCARATPVVFRSATRRYSGELVTSDSSPSERTRSGLRR
jgi:hypothetical protein